MDTREYSSDFFKVDDFDGVDEMILTIANVEGAEVKKQGAKEDEPGKKKVIVTFDEFPKQLCVNKTNLGTLQGMFGWESDKWLGQRIRLYVDRTVMFGTTRTGGVRVDPRQPTGRGRSRKRQPKK